VNELKALVMTVWIAVIALGYGSAFLAALMMGLRESDTYKDYLRFALYCIAANGIFVLWGALSIELADMTLLYMVKRMTGHVIQAVGMGAFCLYTLGILNGVGPFKRWRKQADNDSQQR
jgi:hypothetical protein